jgi:hypothetical protein
MTSTNSVKPSTFTSSLQGLVPDMGYLFGRFSAAQPESRELPERLRFDTGQTDVDPDRAGRRDCVAREDVNMMRLRSI